MGLGIPRSLTVVCGVGHDRESHSSLLGLGTPESLTVVCGVGHSRESHGSLFGLGSPNGSLWGWALLEVVSAGEE